MTDKNDMDDFADMEQQRAHAIYEGPDFEGDIIKAVLEAAGPRDSGRTRKMLEKAAGASGHACVVVVAANHRDRERMLAEFLSMYPEANRQRNHFRVGYSGATYYFTEPRSELQETAGLGQVVRFVDHEAVRQALVEVVRGPR